MHYDGFGHCWGRNGEFCIDWWHTGLLYGSLIGSNLASSNVKWGELPRDGRHGLCTNFLSLLILFQRLAFVGICARYVHQYFLKSHHCITLHSRMFASVGEILFAAWSVCKSLIVLHCVASFRSCRISQAHFISWSVIKDKLLILGSFGLLSCCVILFLLWILCSLCGVLLLPYFLLLVEIKWFLSEMIKTVLDEV